MEEQQKLQTYGEDQSEPGHGSQAQGGLPLMVVETGNPELGLDLTQGKDHAHMV